MKNYTLIYEFDETNSDFPYNPDFRLVEKELEKDPTLKMYWVAIILDDLLEGSSVHVAHTPFEAIALARSSTVWGPDLPSRTVFDTNPYGEGGCREDHLRFQLAQ